MTTEVDGPADGAGPQGYAVLTGIGALLVVALGLVLTSPEPVSAVPSYARQTGQPCATCHNGAYPQLTPFGRQFKLNGYTAGGTRCPDAQPDDATRLQLPFSMMLVPTFTHTQKDLPSPPTNRDGLLNGLGVNNNAMVQDVSVFVAGQIYCKLGAFMQATYDRNDEAFFLDNTDLRYADKGKIAGIDVVYGVSVNNNPTVEDLWNTTPAWRIPGGGSITSAFAPGPPTPMIENLGGIVGGAGAYVMANNMFYAAFSLYNTLDRSTLQTLGEGPPSISFKNASPYWRFAFEKNWNNYSFMVGTYGMHAELYPDVTMISPADKITDVGFDTQLQYLNGPHFFTGRISYTYEWSKLDGSVFNGTAANVNNHLSAWNLSGTYAFESRYSVTLGYFLTEGSTDLNPVTGASYFGTANGSPDTRGEVIDLGYSPWSKGGPSIYPWLNTRLGVQFWHYDKLNGATTNYDGAGRNARDDDTTLLYAWTAF